MTEDRPAPAGGSCDDQELTRRAADGDPAVFGELIRCYSERILHAVEARCGNPEDAQDVLQDTYVAAMRYLPAFRGEATVRGWLYRLAFSACTKRRRGRKNDPRLHVSVSLPPGTEPGPSVELKGDEDPEHEAAVGQALDRLGDMLLELNDLDRAVLVLVDGEGRRPAEVAPMLDLTVSAVKSRLHRARKAIRERAEQIALPT